MSRYSSAIQYNFGFGKQLAYAAKNSLKSSYTGHFSTVAAHSHRFKQFSIYLKSQGIRDARKITQDHLKEYAKSLKKKLIRESFQLPILKT